MARFQYPDSLAEGWICAYIKNYYDVKLRDDLMSVEIDAVWVEIIIENVNYLCIDCVSPPSAHTEYYEKILDMLDNVDAEEKDNFIMGDLKFDYKLDESLGSNPLYYVENAYGYSQMFTEITRRP